MTTVRRSRRTTYRRWVVATTVGELVAFSLPTAAWGSAAAAGLDERVTLVPVVAAGAVEGAVLAYAQSRALRRDPLSSTSGAGSGAPLRRARWRGRSA